MSRRRVLSTAVAGLLAVLATAGLFLTGGLSGLEGQAVDARFGVRGQQPVSGVAVVAIDEATLTHGHGWEWPLRRKLHARMLNRLREAGARQVVYDVQFSEPSARPADDLALYDAVGRTRGTILASAESNERGETTVLGGDAALRRAGGAMAAAPNLPSGDGGVIRAYEDRVGLLPTIAVRVAQRLGRPVGAASFRDGQALIDYRGGPGTIPTWSFRDVLDGRVPASAFAGQVVVVGATAATLQDLHPASTSSPRLMAGPEIQANAIWTALHGNPLRAVPKGLGVLPVLLVGLLGVLCILRFGPTSGVALSVMVGVGYAGIAQLLFNAGHVIPVAAPLVGLIAATFAAAGVATGAEVAERRRVSRDNLELETAVQERTAELEATQTEVVTRLARAAELRDDDTGEHVDRMSRMCAAIAQQLGCSPERAELIRRASILHDVGKIGVPDAVLRKPGPLDAEELAVMREHAAAGARLLAGSQSPLLQLAEQVALTHHERWDGAGYPNGLGGEDIPLEGRIAAVSDVFDALTHARPYKAAWPVEEARAEIEAQAGRHFDPVVVAAFGRVLDAHPVSAPPPSRVPVSA